MPGWQGLERGQLRGRGCHLRCQPQKSSNCGQCPSHAQLLSPSGDYCRAYEKHTIVSSGQGAGRGGLPVLGQVLAPPSCYSPLYHTVRPYTVLSHTTQYCGEPHHTRLHHSPLHHTALYHRCAASCCAALHHTTLLYVTALYWALLYFTVFY